MLRSVARHPDAAATSQHQHTPEQQLQQIYATIHEYLQLEEKYQPRLYLPEDTDNGEVSTGARDGAAHILRCLKVCYDLPADVLIHSINLFDRFLTRMKVRPCHVPCITLACMNIALQDMPSDSAKTITPDDLVSVSQSACTARDVARMSRVIADKLALAGDTSTSTSSTSSTSTASSASTASLKPQTLASWVRAFNALLHRAGVDLGLPTQLYECAESELLNLVEIISCDSECVNARMCEMALVLLYHKLENQMSSWSGPLPDEAYSLFDLATHIQMICNMSEYTVVDTRERARRVLARYEARAAAHRNHRQRLVWRLSGRTLKVLRPTDKLTSLLPTIEEQHLGDTARARSDSESSENETSDWPRSPVLPVYCDN